jgi:cystathionine beta-lyase/cystathionine gamma-synthase
MQMPGGHSPVVAVELKHEWMARRLPDVLHLFQNATSLGGVESLIDYRRRHTEDVSPTLLRLSVGLEDPLELCWDLAQGFAQVLKDKTETVIQ